MGQVSKSRQLTKRVADALPTPSVHRTTRCSMRLLFMPTHPRSSEIVPGAFAAGLQAAAPGGPSPPTVFSVDAARPILQSARVASMPRQPTKPASRGVQPTTPAGCARTAADPRESWRSRPTLVRQGARLGEGASRPGARARRAHGRIEVAGLGEVLRRAEALCGSIRDAAAGDDVFLRSSNLRLWRRGWRSLQQGEAVEFLRASCAAVAPAALEARVHISGAGAWKRLLSALEILASLPFQATPR